MTTRSTSSGATRFDLPAGTFRNVGRTSTEAGRVRGVENLDVNADHVRVVGDHRANEISVANGCTGVLRGNGGRDLLTTPGSMSGDGQCQSEKSRPFRFYGGQGNDVLVGRRLDDVLVGGPGHDRADGKKGNERCSAERERNCER